jgi:hypothetical protein
MLADFMDCVGEGNANAFIIKAHQHVEALG